MRLAIVDDHKLVRDGIRWMLAGEESLEIVGEAADGAGLLALLDETEPDVVLLDVRMPVMSGLEVLSALADRDSAPRVLMLSMYHDPALIRQAIALGASGYISKSADREELVTAIQTVGEGRNYLPGNLALAVVPDLVQESDPPERRLTDEDAEILRLVAAGLANKEIGSRLGRSEVAVRTALRSIFQRLGVHTRSEAVAVALRLGVID